MIQGHRKRSERLTQRGRAAKEADGAENTELEEQARFKMLRLRPTPRKQARPVDPGSREL